VPPGARSRRDRLQPDGIGPAHRLIHRRAGGSPPARRLAGRAPHFTPPALTANLALADALRPVAERHDVSPAAVAVAWTLAFPGVTGAIVGARSPRQVDGWLPAATLELKDDDLGDIADAIDATGAGAAPASPVQ
jgi:aryl-alcohol dehydrogenase-like predicted oxidoreductase